MSSRLLLLVALLVMPASPALAKPPDLPVDTSVICQPLSLPKAQLLNDYDSPPEHIVPPPPAPIGRDREPPSILNSVEETHTGSLIFGVGVNSDAGLFCACCCAEETPIDGLWFGLLERDEEPTPYTELLLNTLIPPLRLRHLSPSNVKAFVEEMQPQVKALNEKCRDMVGHWFADKKDEAFEDQIELLPPGPQITTRLDSERVLFERMRQKALERAKETEESPAPPTCTHSPNEVMNLPSAHGPQHDPKYIPPTPDFPLSRELANMEAQEAAAAVGAPVVPGPVPDDDTEAQEPPADKDCFEVQIQIKNLRTGEIVAMPKMFLEAGENGKVFLQEYGAAVHAQVMVDSLKPAVKMPPEPEQLEVMPHESREEGTESQEEEDSPPQAQQRYSVGQILIVGNNTTPEKVILAEIPFQSGMEIGPSHLQMAEKNLAATGLFTIDAQRGIKPTVEVLYPEAETRVKDVLVTIEEKAVKCPDAEEEDAPAPAKEKDTDEDCWEVQMQIKNVRTGEVILMPKMTLDDGQNGKLIIQSKGLAVQTQVQVDALKPAVKIPAWAEEQDAPRSCKPMRVGQVIIVGNTCTPDHVILAQLPFAAGMELNYVDLSVAEKNLAEVFGFLPAPHEYPVARPKIEILDPESDSEFKDVLITVEETSASRCTDWEDCEPVSDEQTTPQTTPSCPAIKSCPVISPEPECTCPYLKKQQQKMEAVDTDEVFKDDVMDNLDKLTRARKAFDKAEKFHDSGDTDSAAYWYTKVKEICPGSRFDKMATDRLEEMAAEESDENPDPVTPTEPEEESTIDAEEGCVHLLDSLFHQRSCPVPERCCARAYLLFSFVSGCCDCRNCALIWKAHACVPLPEDEQPTTSPGCYPGCHTDAEDEDVQPPDQPKPITDKDIHAALFIGRMFGHPLKDEKAARFVAGLFGPIPSKPHETTHFAWLGSFTTFWQEFMEPTGATEEAEPKDEEDKDEGPSGDCCQPYDVRLQPPLPPIDPKLVETMEKVLKETGDPTRAKLIVLPVPVASDPAEQEEPVSQWPLVPPEVEIPSLFVDPDAELDLDDADAAQPHAPAADDTGEVFQQALDALKKGLYVDINGFDGNSGEPSMTLAVGGLEFRVMLDGEGHRYFLVGLLPEATRDVKLIQQSLNERVMRWIEQMNGGGNKVEEPAEDGSDEDRDDDGGDEEDDMGAA